MLFLLSSDVQSGKTRWLENLVSELGACGVQCAGVLAPGVWRELTDEELAHAQADAVAGVRVGEKGAPFDAPKTVAEGLAAGQAVVVERFEKLGIDNVLLPTGERIAFGRRADLAEAEGSYDVESQSSRAKLGWTIFDEAIERVNEHFSQLSQETRAGGGAAVEGFESGSGNADSDNWGSDNGGSDGNSASHACSPRLLVVDEIGRLELQRGGGLVEAMRLLQQGPSSAFPHALVVVRSWLAARAEEAYCPAWGPAVYVEPTAEDAVRIKEALS